MWGSALILLVPLPLAAMAKAGTGKGNAFAPRGASYQHLDLVRRDAQSKEQAALHGDSVDREREARIRSLTNVITKASTRERVVKQIDTGLRKARHGLDPLAGKLACEGCSRVHGTHHFLCQSPERKQFKTKEESWAYSSVKPELYAYAEERRSALGITNGASRSTPANME